MKKLMIITGMLFSGVVFAQKSNHKYEVVDNTVKATYFYENGIIKQEGSYKDGKLHGKWISYDENGNKRSLGEYANGIKTGKWFFWSDANLSEVDYSGSRVALVQAWKQDALANRN
ncbi:MAG TPA: membrane-binding protein [Flavobacterium sp.]|nr:membrane-binding protein [Flavobacterium sp.]